MTDTYLVDAVVIDGTGVDPVEGAWVRLTDGIITGRGAGAPPRSGSATTIDCAGRTVMPGLIDAHAHMAAVDYLDRLLDSPRPMFAARVLAEIESTVDHGYTTVRDAGYTDAGFKQAIREGLVRGPRLLVSNGPLSQTGGHSDLRPAHARDAVPTTDGLVWPGVVVDGVDQARWGAREVLRAGADQVKVMASGGCASHGDDVTEPQFTPDELAAIVYEAQARGKFVIAHAYNPAAIANAVAAGVRSIEHGNLLDEETAARMARAGCFLVPTIPTFQLLSLEGTSMGMTREQVDQVDTVLKSAYTSIEIAVAAGVRVGSGSDVLARHQTRKALALELQARVLGNLGALRAATAVNAELIGRGADLGQVAEGFVADLLIVDGNPADDIAVLQDRSRIHAVLQHGAFTVDRRPEPPVPPLSTTKEHNTDGPQ
jgi:imidazolonepropionase-like amidohydrolase